MKTWRKLKKSSKLHIEKKASVEEILNLTKAKSEVVELQKKIAMEELAIKALDKQKAELLLREIERNTQRKEEKHKLKLQILELELRQKISR